MIDIHCHILPGVDDGAGDMKTSLEMARIAESNGTTAIIATPHSNVPGIFDVDIELDFKAIVSQLNSELVAQGSKVKIYPGCEIFGAGDFLNLLKGGQLLTLNDSIYPLMEFDFYEHPASVFVKLEQVLAQGFVPIVAHPERYLFVNEDCASVEHLKDMGCLIQINKGSVTGKFGADAHRCAHEILVKGLANFVASDAHSPVMRTPDMSDSYTTVCDLYSKQYADLLFKENPARVLNNQKI